MILTDGGVEISFKVSGRRADVVRMTQLMEPRSTDRHATARMRAVPSPERAPARAKASVPLWRRVVPALAISVMVMSAIYATVPFTFAGVVECRQNGLSGATPAPGTPAGIVIGDVDQRCADAGNSRIAMAASAAVLAAVVGLAGAFAPTSTEIDGSRAGGPRGGNRVSSDTRDVAVHASV